MVFCYKIITETPRRSGASSPTKKSTLATNNVPSSMSQLIDTFDYENDDLLEAIPEHDWRLLAVLARKREQDDEREKLADQFRKMWQREKEEREIVEAETLGQYKRYISKKRQDERTWLDYKHFQKAVEQQLKRGELINTIRYKERRSADVLAFVDDQKTTEIVDKALEDNARAQLAADRRMRHAAAQECRRLLDMADAERRANDAYMRRNAHFRDASQRLAITNALNTWETTLLRQEVTALDTARRASHAARAALVEARSSRLARARENRLRRARKLATITAQMREAIRSGRM